MIRKLSVHELNRKPAAEVRFAEKMPVVVMLENIRSAMNVGSVFRTADAFSAESVYLCGYTAIPPHREILKTALGATETVRWHHFKSAGEAARRLKHKGFRIIAVEQAEGSKSLEKIEISHHPVVLIFGNEISGISEELLQHCDAAVEIPQSGMKHSLNVAVCAGIVLWEYYKQYRQSK